MATRERRSLVDLKPRPRNDAYTVLLAISLVAMIVACALLYYDLSAYPSLKPTPSDMAPVRPSDEPTAGQAPAGQGGAAATPVAPEGGGFPGGAAPGGMNPAAPGGGGAAPMR